MNLFRILVIVFLLLPIVITIYTSFLPVVGSLSPFQGFTLKWFSFLGRGDFISAIETSIVIAFFATIISLVSGLLAAYTLTRYKLGGGNLLNSFFLSPALVPGVVMGLCFLVFFRNIGFGNALINLILAHVVITFPYVLRAIYPCFYGIDRSLEEAAISLGASKLHVFRKVTLPLIMPGIISSIVFSAALSIDDVAVTTFLITSDVTPASITLLGWSRMLYDYTLPAVTTVYFLVAIFIVYIIERRMGLDTLMRTFYR